jgi:hypothetical protein
MNINTKDSIKVLVLAAVLYSGINLVAAQNFSSAPNGNTETPFNIGSAKQIKSGPVKFNTTLTSPTNYGINIAQGIQVYSTTSNMARIYISENGDTTGAKSGIDLRRNGTSLGGLFKMGDADPANNDIAIWNKTKAVVSVKQNDNVEFAGPIKIKGGNPQAGNVLVSTDNTGLAVWRTVATPQVTLSSNINQYPAYLGQTTNGISSSSCPDGELMVGFMIIVQGIRNDGYAPAGQVFCRKVISN